MSKNRTLLSRVLLKPVFSFFFWIFLSSIVPVFLETDFPLGNKPQYDQDKYLTSTSLYRLNSESVLSSGLVNSDIVIVTAHPDDESMFFTPSIIELAKKNYNNTLHLLCLSNGNYDGLGSVRQQEIVKAASFLQIDDVKVLDFEDDIHKKWNKNDISNTLAEELEHMDLKTHRIRLLTFDDRGVSGHPNHFSLFYGCKQFIKDYTSNHEGRYASVRMFALKSWSLPEKYSSFLWVNIQLIYKYLVQLGITRRIEILVKHLTNKNVIALPENLSGMKHSFIIYNNFNSWFVSLSTMTYAHYSQIVWFRWFWIFLSKYMNCNELVLVANV